MRKADWQTTTATVSSCAYSGRNREGRHLYSVEFDYSVDDRNFSGKFLTPQMREEQETFSLLYDPDHPEKNEMLSVARPFKALKWVAVGLAVLLALCLTGYFLLDSGNEPEI
jgi:hypothetical protein